MPRKEPETITVSKAALPSGDGGWVTCDVIEHNGRRWLVGRWIETKDPGVARPERMVLMDSLEHPSIGPAGPEMPVDWIILTPLPASIFQVGAPVPAGPYYVVDHPAVTVRLPARDS